MKEHLLILEFLRRNAPEPKTPNQIAEATGLQNVPALLEQMQTAGLIEQVLYIQGKENFYSLPKSDFSNSVYVSLN